MTKYDNQTTMDAAILNSVDSTENVRKLRRVAALVFDRGPKEKSKGSNKGPNFLELE